MSLELVGPRYAQISCQSFNQVAAASDGADWCVLGDERRGGGEGEGDDEGWDSGSDVT